MIFWISRVLDSSVWVFVLALFVLAPVAFAWSSPLLGGVFLLAAVLTTLGGRALVLAQLRGAMRDLRQDETALATGRLTYHSFKKMLPFLPSRGLTYGAANTLAMEIKKGSVALYWCVAGMRPAQLFVSEWDNPAGRPPVESSGRLLVLHTARAGDLYFKVRADTFLPAEPEKLRARISAALGGAVGT